MPLSPVRSASDRPAAISCSRVAAARCCLMPASIAYPLELSRTKEARQVTVTPAGSLALDPPQPVRGRPPLYDEQRCLLVEVGEHDLGDGGTEAVAVRPLGDWSRGQCPAGDLGLARPLRLGALERVDRGAVRGKARVPKKVRALAR